MSAQFTISDILYLEGLGIDGMAAAEAQPATRSGWAPERLLQAAADGALSVYGLDGAAPENVVRIYVDARPATVPECEAVTDLVASDHVVFVGTRIALTASGRSTLARWSKFRSLGRRNRDGDQR